MAIRDDVMAWIGFGLILGGVVWLGPLMFDQMRFFGDRAQRGRRRARTPARHDEPAGHRR